MSAGKNTLVELWINRSNPGNYCSDIAVNLDIPDKERSVAVTAVMGDRVEIVLYEGRVKEGTQQAVAFTASMRYGGEYECVAYVDGVEVKRIEAKFTLR